MRDALLSVELALDGQCSLEGRVCRPILALGDAKIPEPPQLLRDAPRISELLPDR